VAWRNLCQQRVWKPGGFRTEHHRIALHIIDRIVTHRATGREREHSRRLERCQGSGEIIMDFQARVLVIIQSRAFELTIIQLKSKWADQMQMCPGIGAQTDNIAGIGRDFGLVEEDVEHAGETHSAAVGDIWHDGRIHPSSMPVRVSIMRHFRLFPLLLLLCLPACTWIHLTPGADVVKVLDAAPNGCEKRGEVAVEVKHKIAFIARNTLKVRDELEVLARNEAPDMGANAIHPLTAPERGKQRFAAWSCVNLGWR